jgi:hypothetical protein
MWNDPSQPPELAEFWYLAFHTLFYLDLYLYGAEEGFAPPPPFTLSEMEDRLPGRTYTRDELQTYLAYCRKKCNATLESMTDEKARQPTGFSWRKMSIAELHLYNMRHVQEHGAALSLFLGQQVDTPNEWVSQAKAGGGPNG